MGQYLFRRAIHSVFVLVGLLAAVFLVVSIMGDPVAIMMPIEASKEDIEAYRVRLGLDKPLLVRFADFALDSLRGDFGQSLWQRRPAQEIVAERLPATILLAFVTIAIAVLLAVPLGVYAAVRPRSIADRLIQVLSLAGVSMPEFWLALILIIAFAVWFGLLPVSGFGKPEHIVLPAATLALRPFGRIAQITRSSLLDQLQKQYVSTARAKGLREQVVTWRHAFRNSVIATVTLIGDELASLINGAVVVETIFGWPGIGFLAMQAINHRDMPIVVAVVFVVAIMVILINLSVDLLYSTLDPRVKYQ